MTLWDQLGGRTWRFIDTAGIRKRVKEASGHEYYASLRTTTAIDRAEGFKEKIGADPRMYLRAKMPSYLFCYRQVSRCYLMFCKSGLFVRVAEGVIIHDVANGPHPGQRYAPLHPPRRLSQPHALYHPAGVSAAQVGVVNLNVE